MKPALTNIEYNVWHSAVLAALKGEMTAKDTVDAADYVVKQDRKRTKKLQESLHVIKRR